MKIMSYNIQHGVGMDEQLNLKRIATVIQDAGAAIIGLQEVDRFYGNRSQFQDQVKTLAKLLDFDYCYGANLQEKSDHRDFQVSEYGIAILSQYPIESDHHILLESFGEEQRGVLNATISIGNQTMSIYNTHLGLDTRSRQSQVNELVSIIKAETDPCILLGDFNAHPNSKEILSLIMQSGLTESFQNVQDAHTFPSNKPKEKIDYIFISSTVKTWDPVVIQSNASDHLPIMVTCQLG